jgi:hypothetical protein
MADYFPLVSKAVAGLAADASSERQNLYIRMREALSAALRTTEPPFTDFQIMRERLALEDAVSRVEEELTATDDELAVTGHWAADANDLETAIEIPLMMVSGTATGRLNGVWRCAWR